MKNYNECVNSVTTGNEPEPGFSFVSRKRCELVSRLFHAALKRLWRMFGLSSIKWCCFINLSMHVNTRCNECLKQCYRNQPIIHDDCTYIQAFYQYWGTGPHQKKGPHRLILFLDTVSDMDMNSLYLQ